VKRIELYLQASEVEVMFGDEQEEAALEVWKKFLAVPGERAPEGEALVGLVGVECKAAVRYLYIPLSVYIYLYRQTYYIYTHICIYTDS